MSYVKRNDDMPGYVYLMEAIDFHGKLNQGFLRRCKIGLSDIELLVYVHVERMETEESKLHRQFRHCNVKLKKSREWFDLNPLQFIEVLSCFEALKLSKVYATTSK
jgi:hypothetical protein